MSRENNIEKSNVDIIVKYPSIVQALRQMVKRERGHLKYLIDHNSRDHLIEESRKYLAHFELRLEQYQDYNEQ